MPEMRENNPERQLKMRHLGRIAQSRIFFGKLLRMFVYQNDWKMLPMAALTAGLVGFALGGTFGKTREGTLTGVFAIVCVCIWNGSFNSVQVICRERDVIKREHRSGMHISSYIMSHMLYQLLLCLLQTAITILVFSMVGLSFTGRGLFTPWLSVEVGFTMLLIIYASDMLSLWISSLVRSTTTAMTVMPFILIFQLVFSGGLFPLPREVGPIVKLTVSSPGLKAMASQSAANDLPYVTVSNMFNLINDVEFGGEVTIGQVFDLLGNDKNKSIARLRAVRITKTMTVREFFEYLVREDSYRELRSQPLFEGGGITVGQALVEILTTESMDSFLDREVEYSTTFGEVVDAMAADPSFQEVRGEEITITATFGELLDIVGRKETKKRVEREASRALYTPEYATTKENILENWFILLSFIGLFAVLSTITLEFIDKDKR